jgi:hypothetical protein
MKRWIEPLLTIKIRLWYRPQPRLIAMNKLPVTKKLTKLQATTTAVLV